jgi:hypothetical protein
MLHLELYCTELYQFINILSGQAPTRDADPAVGLSEHHIRNLWAFVQKFHNKTYITLIFWPVVMWYLCLLKFH